MSTASTTEELDQAAVDLLVSSINIPARPSVLQDLQKEMSKPSPEPKVIAGLASKDVALTASVLKVVNSPFYGLSRQVNSLEQACMFLGLRQVSILLMGLIARNAIKSEGPEMVRFWDSSSKRAVCMLGLAKHLRSVDVDVAQSFGLFCDLGIPLLANKFPDYLTTLALANSGDDVSFTDVERKRHFTDHAFVGAVMAKSWGLSPLIAMAIRMHHNYSIFKNDNVQSQVKDLVAMALIAERVIQLYAGKNQTLEWDRGGELAMEHLLLGEAEFEELRDLFHESFSND